MYFGTMKWKWSPNYQMENNQTYQLQMTNLGWGVNYQMQIVTKLPNGK